MATNSPKRTHSETWIPSFDLFLAFSGFCLRLPRVFPLWRPPVAGWSPLSRLRGKFQAAGLVASMAAIYNLSTVEMEFHTYFQGADASNGVKRAESSSSVLVWGDVDGMWGGSASNMRQTNRLTRLPSLLHIIKCGSAPVWSVFVSGQRLRISGAIHMQPKRDSWMRGIWADYGPLLKFMTVKLLLSLAYFQKAGRLRAPVQYF